MNEGIKATVLAKIKQLEDDLKFYKSILALELPSKAPPEPKSSQKTLNLGTVPPEFLEIVQPGQGEKAALRGPRERRPSEEWDKGMTGKCYNAFIEILRDSPDGAPVVHIVNI